MGQVIAEVEFSNAIHMYTQDDPGKVTLDCLVDTGAVMILLPQDVVERLELPPSGRVIVRYADERREELQKAGPLYVKIGEREGNFDCLVGPPNCEPLIGQIVLEELDLIVDSLSKELVVRPESPFLPLLRLK